MTVELDPDPKLQEYAHPERLVTTAWLAEQLDDPNIVIAESDEDVLLYDTGHIPGAVKIDWHADLNDPVVRDYVDAEGFAAADVVEGHQPRYDHRPLRRQLQLVGRLRPVGRAACSATPTRACSTAGVRSGSTRAARSPRTRRIVLPADYPVVPRDDITIRAFKEDVLAHIGNGPLVDVRSPGEYNGEVTHMADYPQEGVLRAGHIPTAANVPWKRAANDDGSFRPADELRAIYEGEIGLSHGDDVVAYCRIGERSSHTWFVLTHLLGFPKVRNYDGSWCEWGNSVRVPIEKPGYAIRP